jgi:hypothetical protein
MKAIDAIRNTLKFSDMGMALLDEMKDAPLLRPGTPERPAGNHAMWIAGHLAVVEGRLHQMIHGTPNPLHHWKPLFDWGSEPLDDLAAYPPYEEVVQALRQMRERTHAYLNEIGDEGLDRPTKSQPPGFGGFDTVGKAIQIIAGHACGHLGALNVVRVARGKARFFVPSKELLAY